MLVKGNLVIGMQGEGAFTEHAGGEIVHHGGGLDMEIPQHFVGAPAPDKANGVVVDFGAEQGHSAGGPQGASRDVRWDEAVGGAKSNGSHAKGMCDISRTHGLPPVVVLVQGKEGRGGGMMLEEMGDAARKSGDRAEVGVTAVAEAHDFAAHTILLDREFQSGEGGGGDVVGGASEEVEPNGADEEGNIGKAERRGVGGETSIFTGTEQEKEGDGNHVSNC